jgi:ribosomal protein S18 acetylase RimI-like enzyme
LVLSVEIRRARESEAREIADLWTEAYVTMGVGGRADPYSEADFASSARHGEVLVAEGDRGIAGVVVLFSPQSPTRTVAAEGEAELSRLAVAIPERGRGIGRDLVRRCEQQARSAGWPAIALWSRPGQVEAHRLYESLGYRRVAERDSVEATGLERLAFRLELDRAGTTAE